ncbi:MAG: hypothetical protein P4L84_34990 [Isosphaeraceae bacterium]|nr:hypothetical protein [Isosphaeraceae bacterium]
MGDRVWLLAEGGISAGVGPIRDRLYDYMVTRQTVRMGDVFQTAWSLLAANYDLSEDELSTLIFSADQGELVDAVLDALFGPENPRRGWTEWATTALLANGLDPTKIPVRSLHGVLAHLVISGRAAAPDAFIGSAIHAAKRQKLGSM